MAQFEKIEELTDGLKNYLNINIQLVKQETIAVTSAVVSDLLSYLLIGFVGLFFLLFASLMAGFYISELLGDSFLGFGIVAAFYLTTGIILFLIRKHSLVKPLREKIIRKVFETK